ncbi:MAG: hypothetical protein VW405_05190 [Rhodospirillaceae bacterium]
MRTSANDALRTDTAGNFQSSAAVLWLALSWAAVSIVLVITRDASLGFEQAVMGVIIAGAGLFPMGQYLLRPLDEQPVFPLLPLVAIYYGVFFGLSVFLVSNQIDNIGEIRSYNHVRLREIDPTIQLFVLTAMAAMYAGWLTVSRRLARFVPQIPFAEPSNVHVLILAYWSLALISLVYMHVPLLRQLPSIGQFIQPAGFVAMAGFGILYFRGQLPRGLVVGYFFVYLPIWLLTALLTSFLTPIVLSIILIGALYMRIRGREPVLAMAVAVFVVVAIYPGSQHYRQFFAIFTSAGSMPDGLSNVVRSVAFVYTDASQRRSRWFGLSQRLTSIVTLNIVANKSPLEVPYWRGATYAPLMTSTIPRVLWPGKPREVFGGKFGHRYGLIPESDSVTSLNIPWLTEAYANFGLFGGITVMFLIGVCLALLRRLLGRTRDRVAAGSVAVALLLPLAFPESNFSLMTGSLPMQILSFWVFFKIVALVSARWASA